MVNWMQNWSLSSLDYVFLSGWFVTEYLSEVCVCAGCMFLADVWK